MALITWFPLRNDSHNQGLSSIALTPKGTPTFTENFASFTSAQQFFCPSFTELVGQANYSISLHVKYSSFALSGNSNAYTVCLNNNGDSSTFKFSLGIISSQPTAASATVAVNGSSWGGTITKDRWYHLVLTVQGNTKKVYVNGELLTTKSITDPLDTAAVLTLNGRSNGSTSSFAYGSDGCSLRDVRIYDHTLSEKEIELLSRDLIVHLPMNQYDGVVVGGNLAKQKTFGEKTTSVPAIDTSKTTPQYTSAYIFGLSEWTSSSPEVKDIVIPYGATYTCSIDIWANVNCSLALDQNDYIVNATSDWEKTGNDHSSSRRSISISSIKANTWTRISWGAANSHSSNTNKASLYVQDNIRVVKQSSAFTVKTRNPQVEFGTLPTDYVPYTGCKTIYDVSGFGYNPSFADTTQPGASTDVKIGKYSYDFAGNKSLCLDNLPASILKDNCSFSWWGKGELEGKMMWGYGNGVRFNYYMGLYCNTGDGTSNPFKDSSGSTITKPSATEWHHYVITCNGSQTLLYVDGVLYGTATTYKSPSTDSKTLYLNGYSAPGNGDSYKFNALLSDFRIYATPLTVAQVKELYQTRFVVDNVGNLFANEFIEDSKGSMQNTGITTVSGEFIESNTNLKINSTNITANSFVEF